MIMIIWFHSRVVLLSLKEKSFVSLAQNDNHILEMFIILCYFSLVAFTDILKWNILTA